MSAEWAEMRAAKLLSGYRLSKEERIEEEAGLTECLESAATIYLENLAHRRKGQEVGR
jgi:hypothetical protein